MRVLDQSFLICQKKSEYIESNREIREDGVVTKGFWVTYMCDLVLGANDSILREFTELDVVVVHK